MKTISNRSILCLLNKLTKSDLLYRLDEFWDYQIEDQSINSIRDMARDMLHVGQEGYYGLNKTNLIKYVVNNLNKDEIEAWILS